MSISFPTNPSTNQTYVAGGKTWTYNGKGWTASSTASASSTTSVDTTTIKRLNYGLNILLGR